MTMFAKFQFFTVLYYFEVPQLTTVPDIFNGLKDIFSLAMCRLLQDGLIVVLAASHDDKNKNFFTYVRNPLAITPAAGERGCVLVLQAENLYFILEHDIAADFLATPLFLPDANVTTACH